jgi:hypothetical protein
MPAVPPPSARRPASARLPGTSRAADTYRKRRDDTLGAADRVFAHGPRIDRLDGCTRCYSDEELVRLGGDPGSVDDDLVRRFAEEGIDHWTESQYQTAWRRLAGRILRLLDAADQGIDVGLLLRGLGYSCNNLEHWPEPEREAVLEVLRTTLDLWLVDGRRPDAVIELLGALAHVHNDLAPWFARIDTATDPAIQAGLVRLAADWAPDLLWGHEPCWWWYPDDPAELAWLCSQAVQSRLAAFAARNPTCKNAADALAATRSLATDRHGLWLYPQTHPPRPASWKLPIVQPPAPAPKTAGRER